MAAIKFDNLSKLFGDVVAVDSADFTIKDGDLFTIVGPSGCGKTTLLRLIAGLEYPTDGELWIGDELVNDVPTQQRDISMVFQDLALFPHMSVQENIDFSLRLKKVPRDERDERVLEAAKMVEIEDLLDRSVSELSGGQQQRVALARSTVRDPAVFLLDEPLSALDAKLKQTIRGEFQKLHEKLDSTMVYVTHDQEEAMTMSDEVAVMNDGVVQQIGTPHEVYNEPVNVFVATFIGNPDINLFECEYDASNETLACDTFSTQLPASAPRLREDEITIGARPEDIDVTQDGEEGLVAGTINYVEPLGADQLVYVDVAGTEVGVRTDPELVFDRDRPVQLTFSWDNVHYFGADGTRIARETELGGIAQD